MLCDTLVLRSATDLDLQADAQLLVIEDTDTYPADNTPHDCTGWTDDCRRPGQIHPPARGAAASDSAQAVGCHRCTAA